MAYPYVTKNNLYQRQYYNYAVCDDAFFAEYEESRRGFEDISCEDSAKTLYDFCREDISSYYGTVSAVFILRERIERLIVSLQEGSAGVDEFGMADRLVKTFEVRKRLYHCYSEKMKPYDEHDFEDISLYILFACAMLLCYRETDDLKYLNALLKANDILLSVREMFLRDRDMYAFFLFSLKGEKECVDKLMEE